MEDNKKKNNTNSRFMIITLLTFPQTHYKIKIRNFSFSNAN